MDILDPDQYLDINTDLLDKQVVDSSGLPVCKADDLLLEPGEDGTWRAAGILVGGGALGPRLGGRLGATMTGIHRRFRGRAQPSPPAIPWRDVLRIDSEVRLSVPREALPPELFPLELWLREHVLARIPGSRHASG